MLKFNFSRSTRNYRRIYQQLFCVFAISTIVIGKASAEDDIVEFDPDRSIVSMIFGFLSDLWNLINGLIF